MDALATIIAVLLIATPFILFALFARHVKKTTKDRPVEKKPTVRHEKETYWVIDSDCADKYFSYYRQDLIENDDYDLSAKELKEDFEDMKVYRYEPLDLPLKMEGFDVYSYRDKDEWEKIGRLKKSSNLEGKQTLMLYPNIYKSVTEEGISKESEDHYFGVTVERTVSSAD